MKDSERVRQRANKIADVLWRLRSGLPTNKNEQEAFDRMLRESAFDAMLQVKRA